MRIIGLTGGIASGKSAVASMLRDAGFPVIDADQVARAVVQPGQPGLQAIIERFGPSVLTPDGHLDRARMRQRIIDEPDTRAALSQITHPLIRASIAQSLVELANIGHGAAFVEAALLVETGSHTMYPDLWVVSCAPSTQLARLLSRDQMNLDSAERLIATQLPLEAKEAQATLVLRNNGSLAELRAQVDAAVARGKLTPRDQT